MGDVLRRGLEEIRYLNLRKPKAFILKAALNPCFAVLRLIRIRSDAGWRRRDCSWLLLSWNQALQVCPHATAIDGSQLAKLP
ncbi:MAG: hypothetical protein ACKOYH_04365, partial [Cyanobium sp.]